jgi:hypothetical protein
MQWLHSVVALFHYYRAGSQEARISLIVCATHEWKQLLLLSLLLYDVHLCNASHGFILQADGTQDFSLTPDWVLILAPKIRF